MFTRRLFIAASVVLCSLFSLSATAQTADTLRLSANYSDTTFSLFHHVKLLPFVDSDSTVGSVSIVLYGTSDSLVVAYNQTADSEIGRLYAPLIDTTQSFYVKRLRVYSASSSGTSSVNLLVLGVEAVSDACVPSLDNTCTSNLVCNGGFELLSGQPLPACNAVFTAINTGNNIQFSRRWFNGGFTSSQAHTNTTADYFGDCNGDNTIDNPYSGITNYPQTVAGNRHYGGIGIFNSVDGANGNPNVVQFYEYISQNMTAPLINGRKYIVSFRAKRAAHFSTNNADAIRLGLSMGHTGHTPLRTDNPIVLSNPINFTDNSDWVTVTGYYTANGSEGGNATTAPRINIGYFGAAVTVNSYYFIDDVIIKEFVFEQNETYNVPCGASITIGDNCIAAPITTLPNDVNSVTWETQNGGPVPNTANLMSISVAPSYSTTYIRRITVGNNVFNSYFTVNPAPRINRQLTSNAAGLALCPLLAVQIYPSNMTNLPNDNDWQWTYNGNNVEIPGDPDKRDFLAQSYGYYKLNRTINSQCFNISGYTLLPPYIPPTTVEIPCGQTSIQIGANALNCTVTSDMQISWTSSTDPTFSASTQIITVVPSQTTTYTRTIVFGSTPNDYNQQVTEITVNVLPATLSISPTSASICIGGNLIMLTVETSVLNPSFQWTTPNGTIVTTPNNTFDATQAGLYTVRLVGNCNATASITITPMSITAQMNIANATTEQTYAVGENITICPDNQLDLSASSAANIVSYQWSIVGEDLENTMNPSFQNPTNQNASITFNSFDKSYAEATLVLTVVDANGCTTTKTQDIIVLGNCCVSNVVVLGSPLPSKTIKYIDALPSGDRYIVVGDIDLKASTQGGEFLIADKAIFVKGRFSYNATPLYGGTVHGPKITTDETKLRIKGTSIQASCDAMWDGLYIEKGASLTIEPTITTLPEQPESTTPSGTTVTVRSLFADSYNGIVENNSGGIGVAATKISFTDFRNNFVSWQCYTSGGNISSCTFSSVPSQMKKPFDEAHNEAIDENEKGYYYAHSFVKANNSIINVSGSTFNGALYGIEFLNTITVGRSALSPNAAFNQFNNCFVAAINVNNTASSILRLYQSRFYLPITLYTRQIDAEKASKNIMPSAIYGVYAFRTQMELLGGGNIFISSSNVVDATSHRYNHIGVFAENSPSFTTAVNGSNSNSFTNLATAIRLTGNEGNNYLLSNSRFLNCERGAHITRISDNPLNLQFSCNDMVKSLSSSYNFTGLLLDGAFDVQSNVAGTAPNQLGNCSYSSTDKVSAKSPQGNEIRTVTQNSTNGIPGLNTTVPNNFVFILNNRTQNGSAMPLRYIRFGNENVNVWPITSPNVAIIGCNSVGTPSGLIEANSISCINMNGVVRKGNTDDDNLPQAIGNKISLYQNYPNPFDYSTTIRYALPETMEVPSDLQLVVIEPVSGKRLHSIAVTAMAGSLELNIEGLASGVYLYALTSQGSILATKKMVIAK